MKPPENPESEEERASIPASLAVSNRHRWARRDRGNMMMNGRQGKSNKAHYSGLAQKSPRRWEFHLNPGYQKPTVGM